MIKIRNIVALFCLFYLFGCSSDPQPPFQKFHYDSSHEKYLKNDVSTFSLLCESTKDIENNLGRMRYLKNDDFHDNRLFIIPMTKACVVSEIISAHNDYIYKHKLAENSKEAAELEIKAMLDISDKYQKYAATRTCFKMRVDNVDFPGLNNLDYWYGTVFFNQRLSSSPLIIQKDSVVNSSKNVLRSVDHYINFEKLHVINDKPYTTTHREKSGSDTYSVVINTTEAIMCTDTKVRLDEPFYVVLEPRGSEALNKTYEFSWKINGVRT